jgi:hypothetical protein
LHLGFLLQKALSTSEPGVDASVARALPALLLLIPGPVPLTGSSTKA